MRISPPGWDITELLGEIASTGRDSVRGGYSRHLFDSAERSLRDWFTARSQSLGLDVEVDKNSNIWAHWGEAGPGTIGVGSHLDSVPGGGAFDGPLGVASALSAIAAMRADGVRPDRPVAVVAFTEEEGSRFGVSCLGSKLMTGAITPDTVNQLTDADGVTFRAAAARFGLDPDGIGPDPDRLASLAAFVELHVEQGRGLIDIGEPVAAASGILAHGRWRLTFTGEGNHAGATTMADRRDPVVAAAAAILAAQEIAVKLDDPARGSHARATVGRLVPVPGGTNVIASRVDAWLDVRGDTDAATRALLAEISAAVQARAAEYGCDAEVTEESYSGPVIFDLALRDRLTATLGDPPILATGAGHDAGVLASVLPTAMLFVRNPTGVSHSPYESASDADCRAGVQALKKSLIAI
jgi:beta-ureidopropionase / N-carbamoyl-L-amino-acid hydrolase